jgi:hypothetical protein
MASLPDHALGFVRRARNNYREEANWLREKAGSASTPDIARNFLDIARQFELMVATFDRYEFEWTEHDDQLSTDDRRRTG